MRLIWPFSCRIRGLRRYWSHGTSGMLNGYSADAIIPIALESIYRRRCIGCLVPCDLTYILYAMPSVGCASLILIDPLPRVMSASAQLRFAPPMAMQTAASRRPRRRWCTSCHAMPCRSAFAPPTPASARWTAFDGPIAGERLLLLTAARHDMPCYFRTRSVACRTPCYAMPCHAGPLPACLPDAAAARRVGLPCALLARWPASHIAAMLRTLPYHALPLLLASSSSSCFGRQTRICISLVRDCIRCAQGGPVTYYQRQSFCRPCSCNLFTWARPSPSKNRTPIRSGCSMTECS